MIMKIKGCTIEPRDPNNTTAYQIEWSNNSLSHVFSGSVDRASQAVYEEIEAKALAGRSNLPIASLGCGLICLNTLILQNGQFCLTYLKSLLL